MRYIIGFILSIILLIFAFVLIFRGAGNQGTPASDAAKQLVSYANTSTIVELSTDYAVSADQTHVETNITVGRDSATMTVYQGYEHQVLRTQTYGNNETSYANFLRALELAGFNKGNTDPDLRDERGYCPTGRRYVYEIKDGDRSIERFWSASCTSSVGNFKGRASTVRDLFSAQIPDYSKLVSNLSGDSIF